MKPTKSPKRRLALSPLNQTSICSITWLLGSEHGSKHWLINPILDESQGNPYLKGILSYQYIAGRLVQAPICPLNLPSTTINVVWLRRGQSYKFSERRKKRIKLRQAMFKHLNVKADFTLPQIKKGQHKILKNSCPWEPFQSSPTTDHISLFTFLSGGWVWSKTRPLKCFCYDDGLCWTTSSYCASLLASLGTWGICFGLGTKQKLAGLLQHYAVCKMKGRKPEWNQADVSMAASDKQGWSL